MALKSVSPTIPIRVFDTPVYVSTDTSPRLTDGLRVFVRRTDHFDRIFGVYSAISVIYCKPMLRPVVVYRTCTLIDK